MMARDPDIAVALVDATSAQTFLAGGREELDSIVSSEDNGTCVSFGDVLSPGGDLDQLQIARPEGQPQYGARFAVSWLTHTTDGDELDVRGQWVPHYDDAVVDPGTTTLGRTDVASAMTVEPAGDIDVLWADAATGTLQASTVSA